MKDICPSLSLDEREKESGRAGERERVCVNDFVRRSSTGRQTPISRAMRIIHHGENE